MSPFEQAYSTVSALAVDFAAHESRYLSPSYQEAEVRKDFIDKFFIALGWDVNHDAQKNPYEQEVKVERGQQQGAARKRADYAFSLAPNFRDVRFFVEAKKPSVDVANAEDYFQTLRYGWNSGNSLAVLTDFEQFHILDCRYKPNPGTALNRLVKEGAFHYREYSEPEKFARLYWLFSREAVNGGSLEAFAVTLPKPRGGAKQLGLFKDGTQRIDESFLEELDEHRLALARAFKKADASLDGDTLTEIVQRTLDRLVFIRFLEDRLIEPDYLVSRFGQKGSAWGDFTAACRRLDGIYNGIVFKKHGLLDAPDFLPDDNSFSDICERLSHLNSPFDFNAIPIHILGSIYERFLGKVIIATPKRVRVEEKPEVRKAGGVYYTPDYIVRYIVTNTVGKLIEGKNPESISKLRFADIACGSGSFLLGIFEELLEYHTAYYNRLPKQAQKGDCFMHEDGSLHLTLRKRREILLNNIYGVDLDAQAVEVAQLSLYLRLLQDETATSAQQHQMEFHETLLPPLGTNIKCGNSLIGPDILLGEFEFELGEEKKIRSFDFGNAFRTVMLEGGFNAIIGNPPYGAEIGEKEIRYYRDNYQSVANSLDTFIMFTEKATRLLRNDGELGYIVPSGWVSTPSARKLRVFFSEQLRPEVFASMPYDVFKGAYIDTMIVTGSKLRTGQTWNNLTDTSVRLVVFPIKHTIGSSDDFSNFAKSGNFRNWLKRPGCEFLVTASEQESILVEKVESQKLTLSSVVDVMRGIEVFNPCERERLRNPVRAFVGVMRRYQHTHEKEAFIDYTPEVAASKPIRFFSSRRILLRQLVSRKLRLQATYAEDTFLTNQSVQSIILIEPKLSLLAILGVLNSALISWYFCQINTVARRDDFPKTIIKQTRELPFPEITAWSFRGLSIHTQMVRIVKQLLMAKQNLIDARSDKDRDYFNDRCLLLDQQIDNLVYKLYGLTEEEIRIVEVSHSSRL